MLFVKYLIILLLISQSAYAEKIDIYIRDDVYHDYITFVDNRDVLKITDFSGKTIRRDVVDMIIAQQALKLGGFFYQFNYIPGKVNFRNTRMLETGKLLISFDSYWLLDANAIEQHIYISQPVIRKGEYIAGLYTRVENATNFQLTHQYDLKKLSAVSTPKWRTDWITLSQLPLKKLVREDEWVSMARMVNNGWVDMMLMPFHSTPDRSFKLDRIHLAPIPGVAIALKDSRHFVISRKHPKGKSAIKAIEKGLSILREKGAIEKAYQQAGFFVDKESLRILNQEQ